MISDSPIRLIYATLLVVAGTIGLQACCTGPFCRDHNSSPDRSRPHATQIELDEVVNDTIDGENDDATDWKVVQLDRAGQLDVTLHWDYERARLMLGVYDEMGKLLQSGKPSGAQGAQAIVEVATVGQYYIRIYAPGDDDRTSYSIRTKYKLAAEERCHNCTPGEQICLKTDGYAICRKTDYGCNAWVETKACPAKTVCRNGSCGGGCTSQCTRDQRRCASDSGYQVCRRVAKNCFRWAHVTPCGKGRRCGEGGRCVRDTASSGAAANGVATGARAIASPNPKQNGANEGRIISIYRFRGQMMLHIELPDGAAVQPGQSGQVLEGESETPLSEGRIRVVKVSGRYCKATTQLSDLGKNRRVRFK